MEHTVEILSVSNVTHDVKRIRAIKPQNYQFIQGQATEVSLSKPGWENEKRPFTFTSLNEDPYLEFVIKIYKDHKGVTNEIGKLEAGDKFIIRDIWGAIEYKGPGYFIAGGAGITPFIAIIRQLFKDNRLQGNSLFFSNKTSKDIILQNELTAILGDQAIYTLTEEYNGQYYSGRINEVFLKTFVSDFTKQFYVCGPEQMVSEIEKMLISLGASPDTIIFEK